MEELAKNTDSAACQKKIRWASHQDRLGPWDKPGSCRARPFLGGLLFLRWSLFWRLFYRCFFRRNLPDKFFFLHQGFFHSGASCPLWMFFYQHPDDRSLLPFPQQPPMHHHFDRMPIRLMTTRAEKLHRLHRRGDPGFCKMMKLPLNSCQVLPATLTAAICPVIDLCFDRWWNRFVPLHPTV